MLPHSMGGSGDSLGATDILIMILVPAVVTYLMSLGNILQLWTRKARKLFFHEHFRVIRFTESSSWIDNMRKDDRNQVLQKAISLHVGRQNIKCPNAQFALMKSEEEGGSNIWNRKEASVKEMKKYKVVTLPPLNEYVEIEPGLFLMVEENAMNAGDWDSKREHTYTFKCTDRTGAAKKIDTFISKCYTAYIKQLKDEEEKGRFMYQLVVQADKTTSLLTKDDKKDDDEENEGDGEPGSSERLYKKYPLSEYKTFNSLFFQGKDDVMHLVNEFMEKKGKFAIRGFPQKLGILLFGPPGTGKTSFVKALAAKTQRHIVTVPLSKLKTNQELYDIMFDLTFPTPGDDGVPQKYGFKDLIFLMEDVDAASEIVKTRVTTKKQVSSVQREKSLAFDEDEVAADDDSEDSDDSDMLGGLGDLLGITGPLSKFGKSSYKSLDKLDLAGLLNVLDGVVDSPQRIVVMTTNHPDKLDPALIRPGRINFQLHMGFMDADTFVPMVNHFFGPLTDQEKKMARHTFESMGGMMSDFLVSPAEVEQLCSEHDTLADFIADFKKLDEHQ